mgnify:CR=1 FL=1
MGKNTRDSLIHKQKENNARLKKKSGRPQGWDRDYVDGLDKLRTQGKGDKLREWTGWYSEQTTDKLNQIFKKGKYAEKEEEKQTNKVKA